MKKQLEQQIEFLRITKAELINMVSVIEDRIQTLKRKLLRLESDKESLNTE